MKIEPAFYATNLKALSFGECRRFGGGFLKGLMYWAFTRGMAPNGRKPMPADYDALEARWEDLTSALRERMEGPLKVFRDAGFRIVGCQRIQSSDDPDVIDSGSVVLLGGDRSLVGVLSVVISRDPSSANGVRSFEVIGVMMYTAAGNVVGVGNMAATFDPRPGNRVVFIKTRDPRVLLSRAQSELRKLGTAARMFDGWPDVRAAMEHDEQENFLFRRDRRGLFVRVG